MWLWAGRSAICVALGLAISIFVAWSCALIPPVLTSSSNVSQIEVARWADRHGFSAEFEEDDRFWFLQARATDAFGVTRRDYVYFMIEILLVGDGHVSQGRTVEAGWPFMCLRADQIWDREKYGQSVVVSESGWWHWRGEESMQTILPYDPIPSALAVNTLVYGLVCFTLSWGSQFVRGAIRSRRGRCPLCGYDLRGRLHAGCPECGWQRQHCPGENST